MTGTPSVTVPPTDAVVDATISPEPSLLVTFLALLAGTTSLALVTRRRIRAVPPTRRR